MRFPIAIQAEHFDIADSQPLIDTAREAFVRYLSEVPRKLTRSKHGLMGPVGKILGEARSSRLDAASLKGYAIRVQEATRSSPTPAALAAMEQGVDQVVELLQKTPVTAREQVFDRLDYGLYYELRKRELLSREARRQAWISFLRVKYGTETTLSDAWEEEVPSFNATLHAQEKRRIS